VSFSASPRADAEKKTQHASEQHRPDVADARTAWRERQPFLNPEKLVFIDETWASTNMARRYARSPRGERALAYAPYGHWKTTTFLAGLRYDRIDAPCVFDGPINGERFRAWVEQFLVPTLSPGDIVVMDNLPSHKVTGIKEAIERANAELLYLPPYSLDLNPIELTFAKIKALLRTAAKRSIAALWDEIGKSLDAFLPDECSNYLRHAGYSA
jgi:transposase